MNHPHVAPSIVLWHLFFCCALPACAQETLPTVAFTTDFPGSEPSHYVVSISADCHGTYDSNGKLSSDSDPNDRFQLTFTVLPATSRRIFELAKRSHYFNGDIDSNKKGLAFTGSKTLSYKDSKKTTHASYNYSSVPAIQELTALFQSLCSALEFGRRLEYEQQYQKLALDEELRKMEEIAKDGELGDLSAIAPILQRIANDHSLLNVVRARALRLLPSADSRARRF
jgi:hypothetical protein